MKEKAFIIKRGFTDNISRELLFDENFLKFQDKDNVTNLYTIFQKDKIKDYRFGIRWIRFEFTYGREYQIYVRNKENKTIKITFKSYFGRKRKILHTLYNEILDALWEFYFSEMINNFIEKHENGEEFSIGDVQFNKDNISLNVSGIFKQNRMSIPWEKVRTRNYHRYFSIYSEENPSEVNRGYNYLEDWNTAVLYSVLRTILRDKKIEIYQ